MLFELEEEKLPPLKELNLLNGNNEFSISPQLWNSILDQYAKKEIIEHFSFLIESTPVPFPYRKHKEDEVRKDFKSLCADQVKWERNTWESLRTPKDLDLKYMGEPLYLDYISKKGLTVSDQFTQEVRMECGHKGSPSPTRQWDRVGYKSKVRPILKVLMGLNLNRTMRSGVYNTAMFDCLRLGRYMASQFKPSCVKAIYDFFDAKHVLDFSAGWGDRLVGFHASNAESYIGIDPNTKLHEPYKKISSFCNTGKPTRFICSPAEDSDLSEVKVDFVFTSPPYFNTEKYSEEDTQSWKRYDNIYSWLNLFLFPTLKNCWDHLEDGRIAINITDVLDGKNYLEIINPMRKYMDLLGAKYEGVIGYRTKKKPGENQGSVGNSIFCEPILIWSKGKPKPLKWNQDNYFGV